MYLNCKINWINGYNKGFNIFILLNIYIYIYVYIYIYISYLDKLERLVYALYARNCILSAMMSLSDRLQLIVQRGVYYWLGLGMNLE